MISPSQTNVVCIGEPAGKTDKMSNNVIEHKGLGNWVIQTYNPLQKIGPVNGILDVARDFHTITRPMTHGSVTISKLLVSVPSQNVAFVYDQRIESETE